MVFTGIGIIKCFNKHWQEIPLQIYMHKKCFDNIMYNKMLLQLHGQENAFLQEMLKIIQNADNIKPLKTHGLISNATLYVTHHNKVCKVSISAP